jgi:hypothetical protein
MRLTRPVLALLLASVLSCVLLVVGFRAKASYLIWWFWVCPLLAALVTAFVYRVGWLGFGKRRTCILLVKVFSEWAA